MKRHSDVALFYARKEVDDVMAAIRFLGENKEEFRLNLDCAFLTGDSAGALLCLFVLSLQNSEKLREADGTEVNLPEF